MTDSTASAVRCPIVGARFYPPATDILLYLPVGTPLRAVAEPTNKFDPNAIQVWIETHSIPQKTLDRIPNSGQLAEQSAWQLGHIAREFAAKLVARGFSDSVDGVDGVYVIGNDGGNRILIPLPSGQSRKETDQ